VTLEIFFGEFSLLFRCIFSLLLLPWVQSLRWVNFGPAVFYFLKEFPDACRTAKVSRLLEKPSTDGYFGIELPGKSGESRYLLAKGLGLSLLSRLQKLDVSVCNL